MSCLRSSCNAFVRVFSGSSATLYVQEGHCGGPIRHPNASVVFLLASRVSVSTRSNS